MSQQQVLQAELIDLFYVALSYSQGVWPANLGYYSFSREWTSFDFECLTNLNLLDSKQSNQYFHSPLIVDFSIAPTITARNQIFNLPEFYCNSQATRQTSITSDAIKSIYRAITEIDLLQRVHCSNQLLRLSSINSNQSLSQFSAGWFCFYCGDFRDYDGLQG